MTPVAFDFETTMIPGRERIQTTGGKPMNVSPWQAPQPVLASWCWSEDEARCLTFHQTCAQFLACVEEGREMVTHHGAGFDLHILYVYGDEATQEAVIEAVDRGLVWDTKILDWLVRLAEGRFDYPLIRNGKWQQLQPQVRGLATLSEEFLGEKLDKNPDVRCGFGDYLGTPLDDIPPKFLDYAIQDAVATQRIFKLLHERALTYDPTPDPLCGPLSHHVQFRAEFTAHMMDTQGVCIDQGRARELMHRFQKDEAPLQEKLVEYGLGEWKPVPKAAREVVDLPVDAEDITEWRKIL